MVGSGWGMLHIHWLSLVKEAHRVRWSASEDIRHTDTNRKWELSSVSGRILRQLLALWDGIL